MRSEPTQFAEPEAPPVGVQIEPNEIDRHATPDGSISANGSVPAGEEGTPPSLRQRIFRPRTLLSFGLAIALMVFFFQRLEIDLGAVWSNVRAANLAILALAFLVYYSGFIARAMRWRWMLSQAGIDEPHGYNVPRMHGLIEIFLLSWFANCVVPAKLGDAYRAYLLKQRVRSPFSTGLGTILAERLVDLVVLFSLMSIAGITAFRGHLPGEARRTLIGGLILLAIGGVGLAGLWFMRAHIHHRLPRRVQDQFSRLHDAIFSCLRRPWRTLGISIVIWSSDGVRLLLVAAALGQHLSLTTAVFVALMSSLLTTLPVTPAGLGVVEAAMIVVLKLVDVEASMAGSIALVDRVVTYWSILGVGFILYLRRVRADMTAEWAVERPSTAQ
ncbi:MAG: lysylphosphatidylglycerol synthase transmembrane domain-containing protein [Thermomicrobiales bacterium]